MREVVTQVARIVVTLISLAVVGGALLIMEELLS